LESIGYKPDTDCTFIPVSGLKGEKIDKEVDSSCSNWVTNKRHFLQVLDDIEVVPRDPDGPLRIVVIEKILRLVPVS
jgi:peptide chain release factor subunit 3